MAESGEAAAVGERKSYLDVLRVVAMLAVMLLHVTSPGWVKLPVGAGAWTAHTAYMCFARLGVPLFFMISGALYLDPRRAFSFRGLLKKNVLRLVAAYLLWSAVYVLLSNFFAVPRGLLEMAAGFILQVIGGAYHLWFIPALIILYLLLPFLRMIAQDRRMLGYFLLLWLVFSLGLETANARGLLGETFAELYEEMQMRFVLGYTGLFMLGYYLASGSFSRPVRILLCLCAPIGYLSMFLLTWLPGQAGVADGFWFEPARPAAALLAAGAFMIGRCLWDGKRFSEAGARIWAMLGKWSFGAYLCHVAALWLFTDVIGVSGTSGNVWLTVPLLTLAVALISFALSALLNQIPFVRRWFV